MNPQIISLDLAGKHNSNVDESAKAIKKRGIYKDQSTVVIVPAFGSVPTKCVAAWRSLITPPNQAVYWLWALGMEVGEAYSQTIEQVLVNPQLAKCKYILTLEADNAPPPDGLLRLIEQMEEHPEYDCIGGLYWTKGDGGVPQIWGDRKDPICNFRPQPPVTNGLVECWGTGMGFNLFRMEMFKDERLRKPWFKTKADATGVGTQDLYAWDDFQKNGHRCAIDCNVLVGHYDLDGKFGSPDTMW